MYFKDGVTIYQNQNGFEVGLFLVLLRVVVVSLTFVLKYLSQSWSGLFVSGGVDCILKNMKQFSGSIGSVSFGLVRPFSSSIVVVKPVVNWISVEGVVTDFGGLVVCGIIGGIMGGFVAKNGGLNLVVVVTNGGYNVVSLPGKGFVTFFVDGARFLGSVGLNVEAASGFCQTLPDLEQANASTNNV